MSFPFLIIVFLLFLLNYIETCPTGCSSCVNENLCNHCSSGYYEIKVLNSSFVNCGKCQVNNCYSCSASIPDKCTSCNARYY